MKSAGFLILCLSCRFVRNSLINLFSSKLKLNSVGFTIFRDHINTHDKVSRKSAKIEFAKDVNKCVTFNSASRCLSFSVFDFKL